MWTVCEKLYWDVKVVNLEGRALTYVNNNRIFKFLIQLLPGYNVSLKNSASLKTTYRAEV